MSLSEAEMKEEMESRINESIMQMERCGYEFVKDDTKKGIEFKKMKKANHHGSAKMNFDDWMEVDNWLAVFSKLYAIEK